jgi:hypothetical protein
MSNTLKASCAHDNTEHSEVIGDQPAAQLSAAGTCQREKRSRITRNRCRVKRTIKKLSEGRQHNQPHVAHARVSCKWLFVIEQRMRAFAEREKTDLDQRLRAKGGRREITFGC